MQGSGKRGAFEPGRITYLPTEAITWGDNPRRRFEEIRELADSVARYGVLQPLSVRREGTGYRLISGERRLRAARLAGLAEVPCVVLQADSRESRVLALVEDLQHRELDFLEQAEGLNSLVTEFGMSQEEAARRVGMSQSAAANKLRLLRLPRPLLEQIRSAGLSERHARALLRLTGEQEQREILRQVLENAMTVWETEQYIDAFLEKKRTELPAYALRDVKPFLNTVEAGVRTLNGSGIHTVLTRTETAFYTILTVKIRKREQEKTREGR